MTAVISAPTDLTTDPLAAAAPPPAAGRATGGDFDLLIALLHGALVAPVAGAVPAPPGALTDSPAADASAPTPTPTPNTPRRVPLSLSHAAPRLSIGTQGERLDPLAEDDARET